MKTPRFEKKPNTFHSLSAVAAVGLLLAGACSSWAGNVSWTGLGGDPNWSRPGNWSPGLPQTGDVLIFDDSVQLWPVNDLTDYTAGGMTFPLGAGAYTVAGNALNFGGLFQNDSPNPQTISLPINLSSPATFNVPGGDVIVTGTITNTVPLTNALIKIGAGSLVLSNKVYSGGTTVSNGLLVVGNDNGSYTMSGGSLMLNYFSYWSSPTITFNANTSVGTEATRLDMAGALGSPGYTWTKTGSGTLNCVHWSADPTAVVKASAIDVEAGVLGSVVNGGTIVQWGSTNVPITVEVGAALSANDGVYVPNPITIKGGTGVGRGAFLAGQAGQVPVQGVFTNTFAGPILLETDCTIGAFGGTLKIIGNMTGAGGITREGVVNADSHNVLILGGVNTYGGNTIMNSGATILASSTAIPGGATNGDLFLNGGSTLDLSGFDATLNGLTDDGLATSVINNSGVTASTLTFGGKNIPVSFSGVLQNSGAPLSLAKIGSSPATFSGNNSCSGSVSVQGGKLEITLPAVASNGAISLANGTELSLHKLAAGAAFKSPSLTIASGATTIDIDLGGFGSPAVAPFTVTSSTGSLAVGGTVTINISGNPNLMSAGQFPLIKYLVRSGAGSFVLGTLPPNITATLVDNTAGKSIDLRITSAPVTTWAGNISSDWDINTTLNWTVLGAPSKYLDGVGVLFQDGATTSYVNITTAVSPGGVLVNANGNYTFDGVGGIFAGDLSKNGSGTLKILSWNGYNNTTISGGTVQVGDGGYAGSLGNGNVQNDAILAFDRADTMDFPNAITGAGSVVKTNSNTLSLSGANTFSGGTLINGGILQLANAAALGAPAGATPLATVASGAAIDLHGNNLAAANAVVISGSGVAPNLGALFNSGGGAAPYGLRPAVQSLALNADASLASPNSFSIGTLNGAYQGFTGAGTITGNGHSLVVSGPGAVYIGAVASGVSQWTIGGGGVVICGSNPFGTGATVLLTNGAYLDSWGNNGGGATWTVPNTITVGAGGASLRNTWGAWWGRYDYDTYAGPVTLNGNLTLQHGPYNQTGAGTVGQLTVSGPISGPGGITKTGPNPVTFTGNNSYTGPTTVNAGTLVLSPSQTGGGDYTIMDGAALDVPQQRGNIPMPMSSLTMGSSTGAVLNLARFSSLSTTTPAIYATNLMAMGQNLVQVPAAAFLTPGQYVLIKHVGPMFGGGSFTLGAGVRGLPGYVTNNTVNSSIDLVVTSGDPVAWVGNIDNTWDISGTANWNFHAAGTTYLEPMVPGDAVTFDDRSSVNDINISATVSPSLVVVSNTARAYSFTNAIIAGPGALLKEGTNTLYLNNGANTFSGGATIAGGTIKMGNVASLNTGGTVSAINGGTLDLNSMNANGITVNISGSGVDGGGAIINTGAGGNNVNPGTINLVGNATIGGVNEWDLRNGAKTLSSPTNAYSLTKVGANTIKFANSTTVSPNIGDIIILGGTLQFEAGTRFGDTSKSIYVGNGAQFAVWQSTVPVNKTLVCSNGAGITVSGGNAANYNIIAAPVQLTDGRINFNANYNNGILFSNVISGNGGIWVQWNSDVLLAGVNTFTGDFETAGRVKLVGNAVISSTNNVTVNNGGSGVLTVQDNAVVNGQNLRVWAGPATGALFVKNNGTINSRTIQIGAVADWSGRSDGRLTLQSGQTLRLDNNGRLTGNFFAPAGSTFSPGGGWYIQNGGILTNSLTLQAGSTTWMDLSMDGGVPNNDAVTVLATLTYGGTLQLNAIGTNALAANTSFKLFTAGTITGSFDTITPVIPGPGLLWDTSALGTSGTIKVIAQPVIQPPYVDASHHLVLQVNNSALGKSYVLYSAQNLNQPIVWTPVVTNAGTGGTITDLVPVSPGKAEFFRYQMQ